MALHQKRKRKSDRRRAVVAVDTAPPHPDDPRGMVDPWADDGPPF